MSINAESTSGTLTGRRAIDLAALVQRREVSPVEIVQAHLARIGRLEPAIAAFTVVRSERALEEARVLEDRHDLGELPLAGVPVAIKDNIDVAGEPTCHGSRAASSTRVPEDDALVRRLRAAGCIVIGKTRMPELAVWPFTEPEATVPTHNPWDPSRTPGGSTGGGGAAVAAGMVSLALGSDGGGSIRVPAACCGIVGLKPGPGIVPLAGGAETHWYGMTEFGPLAQNTADAALMLNVLAGRTSYRNASLPESGLRIAVSTKSPTAGARVTGEVKATVEDTAAYLDSAGHQIVHTNPPYPSSLGWRFIRRWLPGIADDATALGIGPDDAIEPRTRKMIRAGKWLQRRGLDRQASADPLVPRMTEWFSRCDVLLMPTLASTAVPIGKWQGKGWIRATLGVGNWLCTLPWNLVRFPAMSVPAGLSADGLPLAVQLVGRPGSEATLLALAAQLEQLHPWPRWEG